MRKIYVVVSIAVLALVTAPQLGAQELNLEKITGERIYVLKTCDHVHAIDGESKCTNYHVEIKKAVTPESAGETILLNGEPYVIEWMGAGYYTASGKVLQATGESAGTNLDLLEVRPQAGSVHQAAWQDMDNDGRISVSDTVTIVGRNELIVDERVNIRVTPAR